MMQSVNQAPLESKAPQTIWTSRHENNYFLSKLNKFSSDRGYLIEAGLRMIQKNPLTGIGIGAYKKVFPRFTSESPPRRDIHAHNIYLGIGAETGFLGLGFFMYFL